MSSPPPVALVTGVAGGIGRAVALALAARGMTVVGLDTGDAGDLRDQLRDQQPASELVRCDVSSAGPVEAAVAVAAARGPLTALVNCAAILACHDAASTSEAEWDRVFAVNVKGTRLTCRSAIPRLRAA